MKLKLILGAIIALLIAGQSWAADKGKLAVLNPQKILMESASGKKIWEELSVRQKKLQEKIDQKQEELEKYKQDFEKKSAVLSAAAKEEKEKQFQKEYQAFRQLYEESRTEIQQAQREALEPLSEKLQKVCEKYGAEHGYSLILDMRAGVVYRSDDLDITDELLAVFDKENSAPASDKTKK